MRWRCPPSLPAVAPVLERNTTYWMGGLDGGAQFAVPDASVATGEQCRDACVQAGWCRFFKLHTAAE